MEYMPGLNRAIRPKVGNSAFRSGTFIASAMRFLADKSAPDAISMSSRLQPCRYDFPIVGLANSQSSSAGNGSEPLSRWPKGEWQAEATLHWKRQRAASCSSKMISFANVNKQYGKQLLFVDASFQLNPGEKVGLVGPNGAGKTTLFRMVVGEETPDEGAVSVPKKLTIGYFRQDVEEMQGRSVLDETIAGSGRVGDLHHELEALQREMSDPDKADDMDRILDRFGHVQEEYEHLGGYALESQAREVLHGLGFKDDQIDGDVGALSGGWKMRVALARVLLGMPDVLLMDEPTNHLDIESIIWLEQFLKSFPGALLMATHDREFMNRVVTKIAEIDSGEIIT